MSRPTLRRPFTALGAAALLVVLTAAPASAHIHPDPAEIPEGEATTVGLGIEHGCDDSPTTAVAVQLPDGAEVSAVAKSGWAIDSSDGTVTWTAQAGNELPSDEADEFELELTPDAGTEGDTLYLKTVQTCETGELRWIAEWDGEGEEPDNPAPSVTVLAAGAEAGGGDHHAEEGDEADHDEESGHHEEETATTEAGHHEEESASDTSDTSDSSDEDETATIAIVVLVLAAAGFGGVMLVRSRRSTS